MTHAALLAITGTAMAVLMLGPALAQTAAAPAAPLDVPDVAAKPDAQTVHDGYKYFFFHRTDTSPEQATADLSVCSAIARPGVGVTLPGFVAWGDPTERPAPPAVSDNRYGLVGAIMADRLDAAITRGMYLTKMRRCMEPRGYVRYPMSKVAWAVVHGGDEAGSIARQARLATGPKPTYAQAGQ